jgi:hypothetical protein
MNDPKFIDINNLEIGTCDRCKKETEDAGEVAYGVYLCYDCCDDYNDYKFNITSKGQIEEELTSTGISKNHERDDERQAFVLTQEIK